MALRDLLVLYFLSLLGVCHMSRGQVQRLCSFDNGICGFADDQSGTDDFDWTTLRGAAESVIRYRITKTIIYIRHRHGFYFWRPWPPTRPIVVTKRVSFRAFPRGPKNDHTTGSGSYMYAKPRQAGLKGNLARLVSPVYTNVSCVKFYYFMYGNDIGGLEVLVKTGNNTPTKVWSLSGNQANAWKHATIPVNADVDETVKVYLQGVVGASGKASVAIDDVDISSNQCSFNPAVAKPKDIITDGFGSCTFERSSCGYQNSNDDSFDWLRVGVESFASTLGPRRDHTTGLGRYMHAEGSTRGSKARLVSPPLYNFSCVDVSFYYYMFGSQIGTLNVYVMVKGNYTRLQQVTGNQGNRWYKSKVILVRSQEALNDSLKVVFEAVNGGSFAGGISIDDISVFNSSCLPPTSKPSPPLVPKFTLTGIPVTYLLGKAAADCKSACASRGMSCIELGAFPYNTSSILSIFRSLSVTCTLHKDTNKHFYLDSPNYIISGGWQGRCVGVEGLNGTSHLTRCGVGGNPAVRRLCPCKAHTDGSVRLVSGPTNYEGRVEVFYNGVWGTVCDDLWDLPDANVVCKMLGFPGAVRITKSQVYGRGVGTIWLDDVNCKGSETSIAQCSHGGWGNNNCDHYEDAGVVCRLDLNIKSTGDCTFEYDMCGYQNGDRTNSEFDWTRKRGPTPSSGTGPHNDQSGKGYYMYTEVSTGDTGARAKLISPMLPSNTKCISFYYHMRGSGIGWLNVYIRRKTSQSTVKLWTLRGEKGNSWIQGQVPINVTGDEGVKIIFEGVRGNSERGDIAIDTITVSNTSCNMTPSTATPPPKIDALEGDVRLVGDPNPLQGRVEVFHNGQWGTICNNMWSDEDATIVCKMLGYFGLGRVSAPSNRTQGASPIWLDNVQCTGGESNLLQCRKNPWGRHTCDHSKDSGVLCANGTFDDECIRYKILNTGDRSRAFAGQVNQCDRRSGIFPGQWHRFMGPAGDEMASSCVPENRCGTRASGWLNGNHPTVNEGMVIRKGCFSFFGDCCKWSTSIRMKNCSGFYVYEFQKPPACDLRYCGQGIITTPATTSTPIPTPSIITTPATTSTPIPTPKPKFIRLAGGKNHYSGRVEVYHNGVWGTVCDDFWDLKDAVVACRMLGFEGALKAHVRAAFGRGSGKIWMDDVQCSGNEKSLGSCKHRGWGSNNCGHYEDAGVTCIADEMFSCDFETGLCLFSTSNANNGLTWVRRRATGLASNQQPVYDHTLGAPTCLDGWSHLYKGHCYSLNNHETNITWLEAATKCKYKNSLLADIRDKDEWIFIMNQVLWNVSLQYYIGIRDVNGTGIWKYGDGTVMNLTNVWMKGKPSNAGKDKCGAIVSGSSSGVGRFIDVSCNQTYGQASYMCKTNRYRSNLGYYLQIPSGSASGNRRPQASLVSSDISSKFTCLTFYYHMFGKNVDSIRVVFRSPQKEVLVWQVEGNYSNDGGNYSNGWNKAQIPLNQTLTGSAKYKVVIQAARLGSASLDGEIAIDDVNITSHISSHLCGVYPPYATPSKWDKRMRGSCSFGNGTCGYTNDHTGMDYSDWRKHDLANPKGSNIGISALYDHTTYSYKAGSYMFMQHTIGQSTGQSARLISPSLSPDQARCMSFYFYFSRKLVSSDIDLTIFVRPASQPSVVDETAVWTLNNKGLDYWSKGVVPLNQNSNFQVIFEGVLTGSSGVVLDDIWISASSDCTMLPANASPPPHGKPKNIIRLASSTTNGTGRVEIYHRGRWGSVCGNVWTLNNADVVCRQLGYEGALSSLCCGLYGGGTGRVWLSHVSCSGKESSVTTCTHGGWGNNQCLHNQDAAVVCNTGKPLENEIEVRLNGTSANYQGRVEVKNAGIWGTTFAKAWDINDATVVCRQVGFAGAISAFTGSAFGNGKGPIWSSEFHCNGNETKISQCIDYKKVKYTSSGNHRTDAGVECFGARQIDGKKPKEGRVQIQYRGKWGSICGKEWNMNAAHVICRNLGYKRAKSTSLVPKGSDTVLLDEVKCQGDEASIMFCLHPGINIHSCSNFDEVASVECSNDNIAPEVAPCDSSPCKNNGECIKVESRFSCSCSRNFTGRTCEIFIGSSIVGILLRGDLSKLQQWNPLRFKESVAKTLNKYCNECNVNLIRKTRDTEQNKNLEFTPNNIIIVEKPFSRPSEGFLFVEFAVMKTINGKTLIINPVKVRQAIKKGSRDGIAGYEVILDEEYTFNNTSVGPKAKFITKSSDGFKIGFIVSIVVLVAIGIIVASILITKRFRKQPLLNAYQLRTLGEKPNEENETSNEKYTQFT